MKKKGYIDFSASGTALLSSSIVHRMKSELVLKMEEPPKPPIPRPNDEVPPALPFPLRFEYTSTSVAEILRTLQEVLMNEQAMATKKPFMLSPPSVFEQLDEFLSRIEENIETFYAELIKLSIRGPVSFMKLMNDRSTIEIVRSFIMLLFLANQKKILLIQNEQTSDILIRLGEVSPPIV